MSRKNLYIIGARGCGREIALALPLWNGFLDQYQIKGFLDDKADALDGFAGYPPIVSSVEDFAPAHGDVFICGLGVVQWRIKYIEMMLAKGGVFPTFICPAATVFNTSRLGVGCYVAGKDVLSADVSLGNFVLVHDNVTLGHDVHVGDHSVIENGVFCGGFVQVGPRTTLHTRATVLPHKKIGSDAVVGACSCVVRNVKDGSTVFGVPARRIDQ